MLILYRLDYIDRLLKVISPLSFYFCKFATKSLKFIIASKGSALSLQILGTLHPRVKNLGYMFWNIKICDIVLDKG